MFCVSNCLSLFIQPEKYDLCVILIDPNCWCGSALCSDKQSLIRANPVYLPAITELIKLFRLNIHHNVVYLGFLGYFCTVLGQLI